MWLDNIQRRILRLSHDMVEQLCVGSAFVAGVDQV
jgi:hypothetical protein